MVKPRKLRNSAAKFSVWAEEKRTFFGVRQEEMALSKVELEGG